MDINWLSFDQRCMQLLKAGWWVPLTLVHHCAYMHFLLFQIMLTFSMLKLYQQFLSLFFFFRGGSRGNILGRAALNEHLRPMRRRKRLRNTRTC